MSFAQKDGFLPMTFLPCAKTVSLANTLKLGVPNVKIVAKGSFRNSLGRVNAQSAVSDGMLISSL